MIEYTGITLFDDDADYSDVVEDEEISPTTKEKIATLKAYFTEFYIDLIEYRGNVKKRVEQGTPPEPNELRQRRFTSRSVPPLFHFGKTMSPNGAHKKKLKHSTSILVHDERGSGPPSPSSSSPNSSFRRSGDSLKGDTLKNINKMLQPKHSKDPSKRQVHTMQSKASDKVLLEEMKRIIAEKDHMNDIAAQLGKSLLNKIDEYDQQFGIMQQKIEEYEKKISEYQSETAVWKDKYGILAEKMLVVESHNVRLEEELEELHSKHKEEKEKVKPLLMRNRSLRSNLSDLELLKDEVATYQASENTYKRQTEIVMKKNNDLEKEIERLKSQLESIGGEQQGASFVRYRRREKEGGKEEEGDVLFSELGVSYSEVISLLGRLLSKMSQVEQDSFETGNTVLVLDKAGKWVEYMQAQSQPIVFRSLSARLIESGMNINTAHKESYINGLHTDLQLSTLLLICLISLQLCIDANALHEQSAREWKKKLHHAEQEVEALRIRTRQLEGEAMIFHAQIEGLKEEVKHAADREEKEREREAAKRKARVHVGVNTERIKKEEKGTNTVVVTTQHKSTSTAQVHVHTEEKGINTEMNVQEEKENHNLLSEEQGTETISDESNTQLMHAGPEPIHETQEVQLLKKELTSLKEELHKLQNIPSQRVTSVASWEKNYHSEIQGPLIRYINAHLSGHPQLHHVLPANPERHINRATYDGVLLCILVCMANPGILDERVINFVPTSDLEVIQNFALTINTAMAMGCTIPTTNPELLLSNPHMMLDMLYQLVKCELFAKINVTQHPEFVRLRKDSETSTKFRSVSSSELLQRWASHHISSSSSSSKSSSPSNIASQPLSASDFKTLFSSLSSSLSSSFSPPDDKDWIISFAEQIGVKYPPFLDSSTLGNVLLQPLFLAQLAHAASGLAPLSENEKKRETEERDTDPQGTREERAFLMWINGLGIPIFVSSLQHDMSDGLVLLHTLDKIEKGCFNWKEVNTNPNNAYKKLENCNLGVKVCINKLNFSLVNIGGKDLFDGNRKLILGVIWQACKYHLLAALRTCGDGVEVTEADVLSFLNKRIPQPISSFKDTSLRTSLPLLDLLLHLAPDVVKQENIRRRFPLSPEDCLLNAKYAIGLARKIFVLPPSSSSSSSSSSQTSTHVASNHSQHHSSSPPVSPHSPHASPRDIPLCLPILPEDIVEVNMKMLFIFVAMMMLVDKIKMSHK